MNENAVTNALLIGLGALAGGMFVVSGVAAILATLNRLGCEQRVEAELRRLEDRR